MTAPSENSPPIPREPAGLTFTLAMSLLGVQALVQLIAILVHFGPQLRLQAAETSAQNQQAAAPVETPAPQPVSTPVPQQAQTQTQIQPIQQPVSANEQQLAMLLAQSDQAFRIGDYDQVMKILQTASSLAPADPRIIFRHALALEGLGRTDQAVADYKLVSAIPGAPDDMRREAMRKIQILGSTDDTTAKPDSQGTPSLAMEAPNGQDVRDEIGLQPGATLGLIDTQLKDGDGGMKILQIATKARPGVKVDSRLAKVLVYFYEKDETGTVVLTNSHIISQWTSLPIDWANGDPELLEVHYAAPSGMPDSSGASRKYYGYVIGLYYNNELQDTRADPGDLAKQFALPMYLSQQPQDPQQ